MFFYIDESGHTGVNLFDPDQPMMYYGVLSSRRNVDVLAEDAVKAMCRAAQVERLHAVELGIGGLVPLAPHFMTLQDKLDLRFDLYRIAKPDHAVICFFDQVFDQGMNPAITWTGYWTPLRFMLLIKVAHLFDEELAQKAWAARIEVRKDVAEPMLIDVCAELRGRLEMLPDARSRQLIGDALRWAEQNPGKLGYNVYSAQAILDITPNVIGFQMVMSGVAQRIRLTQRKATQIVVDQQSQFNQAQKRLAEWYGKARTVQGLVSGPGMPKLDFRDMPSTPLKFSSGKDSPGLALVDTYIWIYKRHFEGKPLAPELEEILISNARRGRTDEISLNAIGARWSRFFEQLPDPTPEQMVKAREMQQIEETRRLKAVSELA